MVGPAESLESGWIMNAFPNYLFLIALSLCVWATQSVAQLGEEDEIFEVEFSVYSLMIPQKALYYSVDERLAPLRFYSTSWSPRFKYVGTSPIRFYSAIEDRSESGVERQFQAVAELVIDEGMSDLLLVFFRDNRNDNPRYRIYPMDRSSVGGSEGSFRFFNATGKSYLGIVDGDFFEVRTGPSRSFKAKGGASVRLGTIHQGRPLIAFDRTIDVPKDEFFTLFIFPPRSERSLRPVVRQLGHTVSGIDDENSDE